MTHSFFFFFLITGFSGVGDRILKCETSWTQFPGLATAAGRTFHPRSLSSPDYSPDCTCLPSCLLHAVTCNLKHTCLRPNSSSSHDAVPRKCPPPILMSHLARHRVTPRLPLPLHPHSQSVMKLPWSPLNSCTRYLLNPSTAAPLILSSHTQIIVF